MSATVVERTQSDNSDQTEKRLDLVRRFTLASFADTTIVERIPNDALLFLLPDDDEAFANRELAIGLQAAKRGDDVYFRHIRTGDLPE